MNKERLANIEAGVRLGAMGTREAAKLAMELIAEIYRLREIVGWEDEKVDAGNLGLAPKDAS